MVTLLPVRTLMEALTVRKELHATILNGATDLMIRDPNKQTALDRSSASIIALSQIDELRHIDVDERTIQIGSAVTIDEILRDPRIEEIIKSPLRSIGSPAIRTMATLGGNICNASPAGDSLPMLYALDARVVLASADALPREIPIAAFLVGVRKTSLRSDEILTQIIIPNDPFSAFSFRKVGQRKANAISKCSFYGAVKKEEGRVTDVRIAFGAVGTTVIRDRQQELELLQTSPPDIDAWVESYDRLLRPIDDLRSTSAYRRRVCLNLLRDFLERSVFP